MEENQTLVLHGYIKELLSLIEDPLHKRILKAALDSEDLLKAMELELSSFLLEVLNHED